MLKFMRELRRWKSFLWFLIFMQIALFYTLPAVHAAYGFPGAYNSGAVEDLETKAFVDMQGDSLTVRGQLRVLGNTILNGAYVVNDTSLNAAHDTVREATAGQGISVVNHLRFPTAATDHLRFINANDSFLVYMQGDKYVIYDTDNDLLFSLDASSNCAFANAQEVFDFLAVNLIKNYSGSSITINADTAGKGDVIIGATGQGDRTISIDTFFVGDGNDYDTTLKFIGEVAQYSHIVTNAAGFKLFKNTQEIFRLAPVTSYSHVNWYPIGSMTLDLGNATFKWRNQFLRTQYVDTVRADDNTDVHYPNPVTFGKTATFLVVDNDSSGATKTIDWGNGNKQQVFLNANCTFTFTAPISPGSFLLVLIQNPVGSKTATWPASVKWPGGVAPTLTTAANSVDIVSFYYNGTNYYGQSGHDFQ